MKALGWRPKIALRDGLANAYQAFLAKVSAGIS